MIRDAPRFVPSANKGRDSTTLGPGFRFHPTDEELVRYYLKRKVIGKLFRFDPIAVIDVYKFEPWDLPSKSKLKTRDLEWYFFTVLDRKYGNGSRTNRATARGYWKTTGKDRAIKQGERAFGMKKTLVYHEGRAPHGKRSNWVMHEYRIVDEQVMAQSELQQKEQPIVVCRIFEKSGTGPKNGEKYGAPLIEEEWDNYDAEEEEEPVPMTFAAAAATEPMVEVSAGEFGTFVETDDLEKKLDVSAEFGSAGLPSNFYYGECSTYPDHHQVFINGQSPLIGTEGIIEPQNGQDFNMTEEYTDDFFKFGEFGELGHNENPMGFSFSADEIENYLNAPDHKNLIGDDGLFLETDDLLNPVEGDSAVADPTGMDMVDEYLVNSDDDITKYICFDSPQSMEGENLILDEGPLFVQQNVEGDTRDIFMANKNDVEAHTYNEIAASQSAPDNKNPLVKQANKWLASIPAPPAFASEFPTKDIALQLNAAPESSNAAHITTGMVSITDINVRGNAMDLVMSKNGVFSTIIPAGSSYTDGASAVLSGKTAFMLSHGWIYLILYSVMILSITCKIGSYFYTGK